MQILLATGIYPPDIGGPATYVEKLAEELTVAGEKVTVLTYAKAGNPIAEGRGWEVIPVVKSGGPLLRWKRYAAALRKYGKDADLVYAFSSVSCGVPLMLARLKKPKTVLRLGGDFLWERYTDTGGRKSLKEFYRAYPSLKKSMQPILKSFDYLVFSTAYQEEIYKRVYRALPVHSVIENALPARETVQHARHEPLRLLFLGRFVRFKNLPALLHAVALLPHVRLTLVGDGPIASKASALVRKLSLQGRVSFLPSVHGTEKDKLLREHDVLILPSLTELSPHVAVEARAAGLPVLLTEDNGLSDALREGMNVRVLRRSADIVRAVLEIDQNYEKASAEAGKPFEPRPWKAVCDEHLRLFRGLLTSTPPAP